MPDMQNTTDYTSLKARLTTDELVKLELLTRGKIKSSTTYWLLWFFMSSLGIHRFYAGHIMMAFVCIGAGVIYWSLVSSDAAILDALVIEILGLYWSLVFSDAAILIILLYLGFGVIEGYLGYKKIKENNVDIEQKTVDLILDSRERKQSLA